MSWIRYRTAGETWEAMLADIRAARESILLETYIFLPGGIGDEFLDALRERARAGVEVKILTDMVGSYQLFRSRIPERLRGERIEMRFFNPIRAWRVYNFTSWFFRDHRKLLITDGRIGYIGGIGVAEHMRAWRDTHLRIEEGTARAMEQSFRSLWSMMEEDDHPRIHSPVSAHGPFCFLESSPISAAHPRFRQNFIYRDLISAARRARSYLYLTTPYFVPPIPLVRALRGAARRKVDVRLLLPHGSDVPIVNRASHSYFGMFLRAGVRIFRYRSAILHAKTGVSDGAWAGVGSANLDNLSLLFNYEANVSSADPVFVEQLRRDFLDDCAASEEVERAAWARRPFLDKVREACTWPLHTFF